MPAFALGVFTFLLAIYGTAYTPAKPSKQRMVCYKFKAGTDAETIKKHLVDFRNLKREIDQIVEYSAGSTVAGEGNSSDYEIAHYLTFRSEEDVEKFKQNPAYLDFIKKHKDEWEKVLVINAEIK